MSNEHEGKRRGEGVASHNLGGGIYASKCWAFLVAKGEGGRVGGEGGVTSEPTNPDGGRRRPGKSHATMRAPLRRTFEWTSMLSFSGFQHWLRNEKSLWINLTCRSDVANIAVHGLLPLHLRLCLHKDSRSNRFLMINIQNFFKNNTTLYLVGSSVCTHCTCNVCHDPHQQHPQHPLHSGLCPLEIFQQIVSSVPPSDNRRVWTQEAL